MVEVVVRDKERERVSINSGDFCMSIIGFDENGNANVNLHGRTNLFDLAETAGGCLSSLFKEMAKREDDPYAAELAAKGFFMEKFYSKIEKAPRDKWPSAGHNNNNTRQ